MDELKITSHFTRGIISKVISKIISKKFGYDVKISIEDLRLVVANGKANAHLTLDAEIDEKELLKISKLID